MRLHRLLHIVQSGFFALSLLSSRAIEGLTLLGGVERIAGSRVGGLARLEDALKGSCFSGSGGPTPGRWCARRECSGVAGATAAGQKTWAKFSGAHLYKPGTLTFGAHELITDVHWSKWGKKLARATGTYQVNSCLPDCADGTITPTPTSIVLTGRDVCGNRFVFRRMKVYFSGHSERSRRSARELSDLDSRSPAMPRSLQCEGSAE